MEHNIIDTPLDQYIKHNTCCSRKHNSQFLQIRHSSITFGNSFFPTNYSYRIECSTVQHYFKQLNRIISKKLKQISDRPLADKPPCALPKGIICQLKFLNQFSGGAYRNLGSFSIVTRYRIFAIINYYDK